MNFDSLIENELQTDSNIAHAASDKELQDDSNSSPAPAAVRNSSQVHNDFDPVIGEETLTLDGADDRTGSDTVDETSGDHVQADQGETAEHRADEGEHSVLPIQFGQTYPDYPSFLKAKEAYEKENYVLFSVRTSNPYKNKEDPAFPYTTVRLVCIHGIPVRVRGQGKRPKQKYMGKKCEASFRVTLVTAKGAKDEDYYKITTFKDEHSNHDRDPTSFKMQARNRCLNPEQRQKYIREMKIECEAKTSKIREAIRAKEGKLITTKDIHNEMQKVDPDQTLSDIQFVLNLFQQKYGEDPDCHASVLYEAFDTLTKDSDDPASVRVIFFQPGHMKQIFKDHGNPMLVDGTYQLDNRNFTLVTFSCINNHEKTQLVAWCLMRDETKPVLTAAMKEFKEANSSCLPIKIFFIFDKDFNELDCLHEVFPLAEFVICQVHAKRAVERKVHSLHLEQDLKQKLIGFFSSLMYAKSQQEYLDTYTKMCAMDKSNPQIMTALDYMDNQWHRHRSHWAFYELKDKPLLMAFTNNRAENVHKQLKDLIPIRSKIPKLIKALFQFQYYQRVEENRDNWSSRNKLFLPAGATDIEKQLLDVCEGMISHNVTAQVLEQFRKSEDVDIALCNVDLEQTTCPRKTPPGPCTFSCNKKLPCSHLFAVRKYNLEPLLEPEMINNKFDLPQPDLFDSTPTIPARKKLSAAFDGDDDAPPLKIAKPLTGAHLKTRQRFTEGKDILKGIGEAIASSPDSERPGLLGELNKVKTAIQRGTAATVNIPGTPDVQQQQATAQTKAGDSVSLRFTPKKTGRLKNRGATKPNYAKQKSQGNQGSGYKNLEDWQLQINARMRALGVTMLWDKKDYRDLAQRKWLSDAHFNYVTALLKIQFPHYGGLQDTNLHFDIGFSPVDEGATIIQPIHNGHVHWVCLGNEFINPRFRKNQICVYDSLVQFKLGKKNDCIVRPAVHWQTSQLLFNSSGRTDAESITIKTMPCQQQNAEDAENFVDCGIFAIANMISLAFGKDPSKTVYTGTDMRAELLQMIRNNKIEMFQHEERSSKHEHLFKATASMRYNEKVTIPVMTFSFDVVCHCRMADSITHCVICERCQQLFHTTCYLFSVDVAKVIKTFHCYNCRVVNDYSILDLKGQKSKGRQPDGKAIEAAAKKILSLPSNKLQSFATIVLNRRSNNYIGNSDQYNAFADIFSAYHLNVVAQQCGPIYNAVVQYYNNNVADTGINTDFEMIMPHELVHLALMLICDVQKLQCPPLYPVNSGEITSDVLPEDDKELTAIIEESENWLPDLQNHKQYVCSEIEKLISSGKSFLECSDDFSEMIAEIKAIQTHAIDILLQMDRADKSKASEKARKAAKKISSQVNELLNEAEVSQKRLEDFQKSFQ